MALSVRQQVTYWGIAVAVFLALLWLLGDVILPFLVGAAAAYFLNPVVDRLVRLGLPRAAAVALIALAMAGLLVALGFLVIPTVIGQAAQLFNAAPDLLQALQALVGERFPDLLDDQSAVRRTLAGLGEAIQSRGLAMIEGLLSSARGLFGVVVFLIIAPVVAVYLLVDWPRLIARIDELLPRDHAPVIRELARDIDRAVAGFVRGQISVCLILAVYYSTALMAVGLTYGLVVGTVTGLISFIPYIGAIVGGALSIGLALYQFWGEPVWIGLVVLVFAVGQVLEGNVLVPNMVGRSVGLHPVWLLFALSAFGTLFGFAGMLMAVPVAAALGVIVRFLLDQYHRSLLYRGSAGLAARAEAADSEGRGP